MTLKKEKNVLYKFPKNSDQNYGGEREYVISTPMTATNTRLM